MADDRSVIRFFGDLSDPWVVELADALPRSAIRQNCPAELSVDRPDAPTAVVHRATLGPSDSDVMAAWRKAGTRVMLCVGPHVRARDLERASASADVVLNEATAAETIVRHLLASPTMPINERREVLPLVAVVSRAFETRRMLVDSCNRLGFPARGFASWDDATPTRLAVWDAPILDHDWAAALIEPAKRRSILALIGFADRGLVNEAKQAGASACLDVPFELADLEFVLSRLADASELAPGVDAAHLVPPPPKGLRVVRPPVADRPRRR